MIEGITVLSQEAIKNPNVAIFVLCFLASLVLTVISVLLSDSSSLGIFVMIALTILSAIIAYDCGEDTERNEYKVLIDESVSFVEVYEKYDLIDREGEIYIIEEREIKND